MNWKVVAMPTVKKFHIHRSVLMLGVWEGVRVRVCGGKVESG